MVAVNGMLCLTPPSNNNQCEKPTVLIPSWNVLAQSVKETMAVKHNVRNCLEKWERPFLPDIHILN
jgi:hypothetical protein